MIKAGLKRLVIEIPIELHDQLRHAAISEHRSGRDVAVDALAAYFASKGAGKDE